MTPARLAQLDTRFRTWLEDGVGRLRPALWPISQTSAAAGVAWLIAQHVLGHERPVFASITAVVAMGFVSGRRGRQVVAMVLGTAFGIGLADLLVALLGAGWGQIALVTFLGMALGLLISRDPLFVSQVAISAMLLVALERNRDLTLVRLEDAAVGGLVAIVVSVVLFPVDPLRLVHTTGGRVFDELVAALADAARALREGDIERARRARGRSPADLELVEAVELALEVTRIAPLRRRDAPRIQPIADASDEIAGIARGTRVVAGTTVRLLRENAQPYPQLADALEQLAVGVHAVWRWLETGDEAAAEDARAARAKRRAWRRTRRRARPWPTGLSAISSRRSPGEA